MFREAASSIYDIKLANKKLGRQNEDGTIT
jgi:hypothetical protein